MVPVQVACYTMSKFLSSDWCEMVGYLLLISKRDGFYEEVTNLPRRNNAVNTLLGNSFYRNKLVEWITFAKNKTSMLKSPARSSELRADGNEKFKCKNYTSSVELFTESMAHALYNSKEMALAVANRSAALFYLGAYEECLKDIELALSNNYPEPLKYKLYTRRADCMVKLNRYKEALGAYNCASELLKIANLDDAEEKELQITKKKSTVQMKLKACHDVGTSGESEIKPVDTIPVVTHGESDTFASASAALSLRYDPSKGRHVVTKQDISVGDIIFVEKPYAFVVLPDYCRQYCHHCCKLCTAPIPCTGCTRSFYCGKDCRVSSWQEYHKYECSGGVDITNCVGIVHLALRIVLKADPLCTENSKFIKHSPDKFDCASFGNKQNNYPAVYSLLTHMEDIKNDDFFQCTMTATLLFLYLKESTEYLSNRQRTEKNIDFIGRLMLRHTTQLMRNTQAISKIESAPDDLIATGVSQFCIGAGIYPSVSMMNHSCNPNIMISFCGEYIVVRAIRRIAAGTEVFNCYGPHFTQTSVKERQEILKAQYFFTCSCDSCMDPAMIESDKHSSAWLCPQCSGPLILTKEIENKKKIRILTCCDCRHNVRGDRIECYIDQANICYKKGVDAANSGDIEKALLMLKQCLSLREKYLYKKNTDIFECLHDLAQCCLLKGDLEEFLQFQKRLISMTDDHLGETSTVMANELQKLSDFITCMKESPPQGLEFLIKLGEAQSATKKIMAISDILSGKSTNDLQDVLNK